MRSQPGAALPLPEEVYRVALSVATAKHIVAVANLHAQELTGDLRGDQVTAARRDQRAGMAFTRAPYNAATIDLMTAALEAAWFAARMQFSGLSRAHRTKMEKAILRAVGLCVRDFRLLQQHAFDALDVCGIEPVERRQRPRARLVVVTAATTPIDRGSPRARRRTSP